MSIFTKEYLDRAEKETNTLPNPLGTLRACATEIRRLQSLMVFIEPDGTRTKCTEVEWVAKREAAAATIGKLHMTKDGVRVVPGADKVYRCMHMTRGRYEWVCEIASTARHLTECSYSSLKAAEASGYLEAAEEKHKQGVDRSSRLRYD